MEKDKQRVELHCHSNYSEMDGVSSVRDIIEFAASNGMSAVALTDHASVAGYGEAAHYASQHDNIKMIYGMEAFVVNDLEPSVVGDERYIKECPSFHVTFLIQNEEGKENLYRLMSIAEEKYKAYKPRIPWSEIQKNRKGLLIGSACEVGELYLAVMNNESDEVIEEIASRCDYIEIQPAENKLYCLDDDACSYEEGLEYVRKFDKKVIEIGERLGIPVVATSDAHFVTQEEGIVRAVLQRHVGYEDDHQLKICFRTTEEMLQGFSYLGEEKAWEIVVENSNKIAEMIDDVKVIYKTAEFYPRLDNASERLREICYRKLEKIYGDNVTQEMLDQVNWELHSLMESGSDSIMLHARELVDDLGISPYKIGYRGCLGSSAVAYLCGITCVNPFETKMNLYPEFLIGLEGDKWLDIDLNFPTEIRNMAWDACNDLEDVGNAFHGGVVATIDINEAEAAISEYEDYHGIAFEPDMRARIIEQLMNVTKRHGMNPGAMLIVPEDYGIYEFTPLVKLNNGHMATDISHHYLECLNKFDILTNKHINMLYQLIQRTGVHVADISLDDSEVGKLLGGKDSYLSQVGIPEFDSEYVRDVAKELDLDCFTDVVQLICLMHGTNVWENKAKELILQGGYTKDNVIASREDIFECLLALGFCREDAFKIAEFVRKGKARYRDEKWREYKTSIEDAGAPEWFIESCEKISYMFPRAHAYIYALHAWWIAWFKLHYTKDFYEVYVELQGSDGLKEVISKGKKEFENYRFGYQDALAKGLGCESSDAYSEELLVAGEMFGLDIK